MMESENQRLIGEVAELLDRARNDEAAGRYKVAAALLDELAKTARDAAKSVRASR